MSPGVTEGKYAHILKDSSRFWQIERQRTKYQPGKS